MVLANPISTPYEYMFNSDYSNGEGTKYSWLSFSHLPPLLQLADLPPHLKPKTLAFGSLADGFLPFPKPPHCPEEQQQQQQQHPQDNTYSRAAMSVGISMGSIVMKAVQGRICGQHSSQVCVSVCVYLCVVVVCG
jgi:hypothetical protein